MRLIDGMLLGCFCLAFGTAQAGADFIFRDGFEEGTWIDVTGPTFWQCQANCNLVNGEFVDSGSGMALASVGNWGSGLRFVAIRVDATENPILQLSAGLMAGGIDFGICPNYVVRTECRISAAGTIPRLNLYISGTVRKIELRLAPETLGF